MRSTCFFSLFHFSLFSARKGICPFCFAKDGLLSSSLSRLFCYTQRKGIKGKSLIPFLARKERLDRASPVLLASQALPFLSLLLRKRWTIEFESLPFILLYTKKRYQGKILDTFSGAEGETRQGKPCLACFASSPIFVPFASQKMDY